MLDTIALLDLLQSVATSVARHMDQGMEFCTPKLHQSGGPLCIVDGVRGGWGLRGGVGWERDWMG